MEKDKYIGKRLEGRYEIQELVGMGGMANVYKAFDVIDQRTVAVKILRDEYLGNEEFLRRFKNESKAIAVLSHPNIVRVYDVSFTGKVHSIVMEYIDGITLKDYIERQSVLTWKESIHFTLQILRALQHAHDKGIVHRDIKPHNIMLLQNGTIKVTDFGIARFARSEVKTITDRAIGSVHYISPEQAMGEVTDEKSDIYSVGVMLFEMLTGRLPFEADTAVSVALQQIQSQAVKPTSINPTIPEGLEHITLRAMQKDASRRYQSAAEMIADIEKFKADPSIHFQYKYMDAESPAAKNKKLRKAIKETREEDTMPKQRKTPYIPILTGVTLAFVLASAGFIALMIYFNNPFTKTKDIPVPKLEGIKYETALTESQGKEYRIALNPEEVYHDDYAKGVICEQNPRYDGPQMKANSTISVKVSLGPKQVTLTNYTGQSAEQVMQKLREDGLEPKQHNEHSDTVPMGYVIYTDPSKGSNMASGDIVNVYVSIGPKEQIKEIPGEIVGMSIDEAFQYLEFQPFQIGDIKYEASDLPEGTIISLDPPAGSYQPEGTIINIVASKGGAKSLVMNIPIKRFGEPVTIRARAGDIVYDEVVNFDTSEESSWRPTITGEENEEIRVIIYIRTDERKSVRYQTWLVNIGAGTQELIDDRSNHSDFNF